MPGGDTSNGNQLWIWDCNGGSSQHWVFDNWAIRYGGDTNKCVDISGGQISAGTALQLWDCNGNDGQKWGYDSNMKTIYAGASQTDASQCMDSHDGNTGTGVMLWGCNGLPAQTWGFGGSQLAMQQERRVDPMLGGENVTYREMASKLSKMGLSEIQLECHWANIHASGLNTTVVI